MKIYLEIDSFSSLDYYRIFKTKIREDSISQVIDGLILTANFLFKNEIEKIQKIKQIVSNFNIPIILNPNTNSYYQFETNTGFIDNDVKERFQKYYNLNSFIFSNTDNEIQNNIERIITFQKDFFKIEETIEPGTLLDFLDEADRTKVIKIDHHLITPYLFSGINFQSNNLNDYIRLSSNFQNEDNQLFLFLYFDETMYYRIETIITNWSDHFSSIILWNNTYNEFYNSKAQLTDFKNFLDKIIDFKDKLIFSYPGLLGLHYLQDFFSGFIIKKQLYPGDKKTPPTQSQIQSPSTQIKFGRKSRTFYNPNNHCLNTKLDIENPATLEILRHTYNCECFVCENKILNDRRFFDTNIVKLIDNTRNKFYHNLFCILKDILILKTGNNMEINQILNNIEKYNNWREVFV